MARRSQGPSTGGAIKRPDMTRQPRTSRSRRTPYDNPADVVGRWSGLTETELLAAAEADPMRFAADHVPAIDRREGSVVLLLDLGEDMGGSMNVIPNAPSNPTPGDCRPLLQAFLNAAEQFRHEGLSPSIGLLHHRTGAARITDVDRRWAAAIDERAAGAGIPVIGVAARTESGAFVVIHLGSRGISASWLPTLCTASQIRAQTESTLRGSGVDTRCARV